MPEIDDEDMTNSVTEVNAVITFSTSEITSSDASISIEDSVITITSAGTYELTGTSDQATIYVDSSDNDSVIFVLNNVSLSSATGPIFYINNADKVIINVKESTVNTLTDLSLEAYEKDSIIYSKDDLTINGTGSLTIDAGLQKGIKVNDDLVIYGTTLNITSSGHSIKVNNKITISEATITINSGGDGIQSDNEDDNTESLIYLESGTFNITSYGDGISSSYDLTIFNGTYNIVSGYQNSNVSDTSAKGLKATNNLYIVDGTIDIDSKDDGMHSDDGLIIFNGTLTISSDDDGIHANNSLSIQGGTITITDSYEGIEGKYITISGGYINVFADDDGINGSDPDITGSTQAPGTESESTSTAVIEISGGIIIISSEDDSIDSNGEITISGGTIVINGPTSGTQSAIDYDLTWAQTGGTIVAVAGYGNETKSPTEASSTQTTLVYNTLSTRSSGTLISLLDEDGQIVVAFRSTKSFQAVIISSPELDHTTTYTLAINGTITGELENGYYASGTLTNYQTISTFILDDVINTFNVSTSSSTTPPRR